MQKPTKEQMQCAHWRLEYVSDTLDLGLLYKYGAPEKLVGYTNVD